MADTPEMPTITVPDILALRVVVAQLVAFQGAQIARAEGKAEAGLKWIDQFRTDCTITAEVMEVTGLEETEADALRALVVQSIGNLLKGLWLIDSPV